MREKTYSTACGEIHYWVTEQIREEEKSLIFLPDMPLPGPLLWSSA